MGTATHCLLRCCLQVYGSLSPFYGNVSMMLTFPERKLRGNWLACYKEQQSEKESKQQKHFVAFAVETIQQRQQWLQRNSALYGAAFGPHIYWRFLAIWWPRTHHHEQDYGPSWRWDQHCSTGRHFLFWPCLATIALTEKSLVARTGCRCCHAESFALWFYKSADTGRDKNAILWK